jgi:ATP-dependent helicase HrpA
VAGGLAERTLAVVRDVAAILDAARDVERRLEALTAPAFADARADVAAQLRRLVHPRLAAGVGAGRLGDVRRYLLGAARRLERLPDNVAVDRDRMRAIHELEAERRRRLAELPPGAPLPPGLAEVPWMLEELRMSQFAQGLGVRGSASAKKVRQALAAA